MPSHSEPLFRPSAVETHRVKWLGDIIFIRPIKQGEVLYVLPSERQSSSQGDAQAAISRQVEVRQQSLRDEMHKTVYINSA